MPAGEIDNGETPETQAQWAIEIETLVVGPAVDY
jgi:hypothetical protein